MKKYLFMFLLVFVGIDIHAEPIVNVIDYNAETISTGVINFDDIKDTNQQNVVINESVIINNFADWQNWDPLSVTFSPGVSLYITDMNTITNGEKVKHVSDLDTVSIIIQDTNRLYKANLTPDLHINIVRETNYESVFNNARGKFLENIRSNNSGDKMLLAMDNAKDMDELNYIMNSSYHFNPMILLKPMKIINRATINNISVDEQDLGIGARVDYIVSNKLNNVGTHMFLNHKYEDLYFHLGVNFDNFSYSDNFNEFDGFSYGLDLYAKQYLNKFWLDGLLGINRSVFKVDNIYNEGNVLNNPKGVSKYGRFGVGYDYTEIQNFVISPFIEMSLERYDIIDVVDTDINLYAGTTCKYSFITDGIKYEYGATISMDEKANWNTGINIGFVSVADRAGAFIKVDAFKYDFDINYKLSVNAKIEF